MRGARGTGQGAPRSPTPTARPAAHTRASLTRVARWGKGLQTPFRASGLPHPERKAKEPERGDKRKGSTLWIREWELPLPPGEVKPLAAQSPSNPPTQPFKPLSPPCHHPLLRAPKPGPGSWRGSKRRSRVHASLRGGGGDTIPSEVAWRGLLGTEDSVLPSRPRQAALRSTQPAAPPAGPDPGLQPPRSAPAPRIRARSRGGALQPSSLASHPLQSSFTKLSDFLSPKGVSWGDKARTSRFPHRPPRD